MAPLAPMMGVHGGPVLHPSMERVMHQRAKSGGATSDISPRSGSGLRPLDKGSRSWSRIDRVEQRLLDAWHLNDAPALRLSDLSGVKVA